MKQLSIRRWIVSTLLVAACGMPISVLAQSATAEKTKADSAAAERAKADAAARAKALAEQREAAIKKFSDQVDVRFDQPYAGNDNPKQQVDVFLPKKRVDDKLLPVVVFIHGGGWSGGDRKTYVPRAMELVSSGKYAAVAVGYRLSGEVKWPAQIYDCKAAIRYIRGHAKEWNIDPDKIGVTGASAGGHLVTLLGVSGGVKNLEGNVGDFMSLPSTVTAVINFCGPSDFTKPLMQGEAAKVDDPAVAGVLGGPINEHLDAAHDASPVWHLQHKTAKGKLPPIMTVHGTDDGRVDFKHAEMLDAALKEAGGESIVVAMKGMGHGITIRPALAERMQRFWDTHLRGEKHEISGAPIDGSPEPEKK